MVLRVNLPQIPYKADTAVPDYVAALTQGFTQGLKPRSDSEALLSAVLGNKIKKAEAEYAPMRLQSEAASKLAYANLMGPQFLAKLMGNDAAMGNLTEMQKKLMLQKVYGAGTGQSIPSSNIDNSKLYAQRFMNAKESSNTQPQINTDDASQPYIPKRPKGAVSLEGAQWYDKNGNPVYEEDENLPPYAMKIELTKDIPSKTYAEKAGEYKGTIKQREQEGKYRADALNTIGQSQLGLSQSGATLDRLTDIVKNPVFWNMRDKIPFFQDKQLSYLQKAGTPEEQELIGDFLSTAESFIASTVQSFGGKPLVREFDLAQRQKITPNDTVSTALGKLRSARALHDVAEKKNQIVSELLQKGYNESDAIKQANKMIDIKNIEKATNDLLQRRIEIRNSKTGEKRTVTIEEARKMGVPNV